MALHKFPAHYLLCVTGIAPNSQHCSTSLNSASCYTIPHYLVMLILIETESILQTLLSNSILHVIRGNLWCFLNLQIFNCITFAILRWCKSN